MRPTDDTVLIPGAEPFSHRGSDVGVLLCHGFTGSPRSMRPWADHLVAAGLSVELPLLPGHGTVWTDMALTTSDDWYAEVERALLDLSSRCSEVFVMGLSMGGALSLRLAQEHPDLVRGAVLVNPSLAIEDPRLPIIAPFRGLAARLLPFTPGVESDIAKDDVGRGEGGYDRVPTAAAATLPKLWRAVQEGMSGLRAPILAYRSPQDHVVGPRSLRMLAKRAVNTRLTIHLLHDSYHVATLDHDAADIFDGSLAFVRAHARSGEGADR
ncbi:alpha/beta hydrolase [Nocardiopsis lambiniae]|uniref:Alpha/beta fold hydrolase n=1 Tax=Nocardiopsis lambiniae TaxID=3075539 RepID=A0ABU2M9H0_9ACTN|nr:alpha/beta fold hydrolase [Nocardiopsis sp. DSM 44743]MDT0328805.1 alpha/beta fold hydrolase [Nocardiopsis sp. DSM 44743]